MKKTLFWTVNPEAPEPEIIARAAAFIQAGKLVVFPTETVYGLGANGLDAAAVAAIFEAKNRPLNDPVILHIASLAQLSQAAEEISDRALAVARAFWPGPLTLIFRRPPHVPPIVAAGLDRVAVRMPAHPVALALIQAAGVPIAAPSANLFSRPSPTTAQHVLEDLDGRVDLVLDGGPCPIGVESTVLDVSGAPPVVLRPGGAPLEALRRWLPEVTLRPRLLAAPEDAPAEASPGMLLKHYSPRAPLLLFSGPVDWALAEMRAAAEAHLAEGRRVGVMAAREDAEVFAGLPVALGDLGAAEDLEGMARRLFFVMRALDAAPVDVILARDCEAAGLGLAIHDRLLRAAEGRLIQPG